MMRARVSLLTVLLMALMTASSGPWSPQRAFAGSPAHCAAGDRQEPALQGQVPQSERLNGAAEPGYWCNLQLVGQFSSHSFANFDTYKNCAYYTDHDGFTTDGHSIVLDVSDPQHPVKTATLTARAMRNAGESMRVNQARGLLVADHYSILGISEPEIQRTIAVYDVSEDCAHPTLLADAVMPAAVGHEGCFQPDGMVYYMASGQTITPIDLSDPAHPKQLSDPWPLKAHGCSISDDGNRGYFASTFDWEMSIVDTSQAQARVAGAQPHVIARFPTPDVQIEQATVPVSYGGHPYVILWSEAKIPPKVCMPGEPNFGYPRIIDLADESHPTEVSKIQTEVVLPQNCAQVAADAMFQTGGVSQGDPGYLIGTAGFVYDSHMCTPDRLHDPTILACAQLGSGLRVYDIRNPQHPTEIAYYNTGTTSTSDPRLDWAFARPVIRSDLGQIWWVTNLEGFRVAKFREGVWPFPGSDPCPSGYDYFQDQYDLGYQACRAANAG
jgi:hypothetical protein